MAGVIFCALTLLGLFVFRFDKGLDSRENMTARNSIACIYAVPCFKADSCRAQVSRQVAELPARSKGLAERLATTRSPEVILSSFVILYALR